MICLTIVKINAKKNVQCSGVKVVPKNDLEIVFEYTIFLHGYY